MRDFYLAILRGGGPVNLVSLGPIDEEARRKA